MNHYIQFPQHTLTVTTEDVADCISLQALENILKPAPHVISKDLKVRASLNDAINSISKTHQFIEAAGGLVFNPKGELLVIFRRGFWDLPKGKIDKRETPSIAALREVEEETGVHGLMLQKQLSDTYHTYFMHNKYILKKTYWYRMVLESSLPLIPQIEEDIEQAVWMNKEQIAAILKDTYPNIQGLFQLVLAN